MTSSFSKPFHVARYQVASDLWFETSIRLAILSDLHACSRWMPLPRLARLVAQVNSERPDLILMPGDFLVGHLFGKRPVPAAAVAEVLKELWAPLGVFATLGNHDWSDCPQACRNGYTHSSVAGALESVGIPVLSNRNTALRRNAYLVGLDSAIGAGTTLRPDARHDPQTAFKGVPEGASTILMAHEPDFFLDQCRPVALQVSGHTHGGQVGALGIWATRPSRYGTRLDYGLKRDGGRNLVVTAGVGYGGVPVRIGKVSEFAIVTLHPSCAADRRSAAPAQALGN
ncbi:metallophosphoesterase [Mesorhizobium sp. Z1-4]|uniref:metallophosphoesterase n=1 Tax=Mesorhizobium sp. Z1-4 TaxID=2448478 RepID=UPI000FDA7C44|nr:metallophosphoesterase [Mesorhizobium sp. Z1-4]